MHDNCRLLRRFLELPRVAWERWLIKAPVRQRVRGFDVGFYAPDERIADLAARRSARVARKRRSSTIREGQSGLHADSRPPRSPLRVLACEPIVRPSGRAPSIAAVRGGGQARSRGRTCANRWPASKTRPSVTCEGRASINRRGARVCQRTGNRICPLHRLVGRTDDITRCLAVFPDQVAH